ncbi:13610_t:CDS:10 [Ambispora leptoticha]|uniref:13610_t:CDS:1 n=1 Tax=Ambispora leptoticha TaxID=144679 RepID=A0A9N9ARL5_9GLOM|nr:13610_t:CDS:10 [Ambispora leptoticha]
MDVDKFFKLPSIPSGKNKRKLPATPNLELLKRSRVEEESEEEDVEKPVSASSSKNKGKSVRISDEVEEREYYKDYYEENVDEEEGGRFYGGGLTEEQLEILDYVDQVEIKNEKTAETLDVSGVRKMILKFEKAIIKNQELRVKFPDDPQKFMDSEADLHEEIKHLMALTEAPDLIPFVVELGAISHLASLLAHENTDIAIDVVELLNDLTEDDVMGEDNDEALKVLIDSLVENQVLELLVQNLNRLEEEEAADKQGVFNTLGVIENLTSFDPSLSEVVIQKTNLMEWILNRIKVKAFDSNKQYASEILAILLQDSRDNRLKLSELNGVDVLLQVLNAYKRKDPKDEDETEMMENFFDALCSAVTELEVKQKFLEGEGVELMLIMMKEKNMSRMRAIKVLDHAMWTVHGRPNCIKFVEIFGLKTLFAAFMRKGLKKFKKMYKSFSETEEEEHILGIIVSLIKNLPVDSDHRLRLVQKFTENDYEKVDRLLELRENYEIRVSIIDQEIEEKKQELEGEDIDDDILEEFYRKRLSAGLFTLQLVDITIAWICGEDFKIKEHVKTFLNRRKRSLEDIRKVLEEYLNNLGDADQNAAGYDNAELQPPPLNIEPMMRQENKITDLDDNEQSAKINSLFNNNNISTTRNEQEMHERILVQRLINNLQL